MAKNPAVGEFYGRAIDPKENKNKDGFQPECRIFRMRNRIIKRYTIVSEHKDTGLHNCIPDLAAFVSHWESHARETMGNNEND